MLVVLSFGLTFALNVREARVRELNTALGDATESIRYDMLQMSDGMRGMLLAPESTIEKKRKFDADEHVSATMERLKTELADAPDLKAALVAISEFDEQNLNVKENKVIEQIGTDPKAAAEYYNTTYLPTRRQLDQLVDIFEQKATAASRAQLARLDFEAKVVYGGIGGLLLLCFAITTIQTRRLNHELRRIATELTQGATQTSAAATQVSASSQALAEGASEQATHSLEET